MAMFFFIAVYNTIINYTISLQIIVNDIPLSFYYCYLIIMKYLILFRRIKLNIS